MTGDPRGWFGEARFGMFIHWSPVSRRGWEMSWPLVGGFGDLIAGGEVPVADYYDGFEAFAPEPGAAREWADLAKRAGMQYAVFTTKHHDGFAMFPSRHSDFTIRESAYDGDDLVAEYVEAFRAAGLRVGFYFSLPDWHHPDYPAFTDDDRPYLRYLGRRSDAEGWDRFMADVFGQIEELLTAYGTIDLLWFDGQWERSVEEWRVSELASHIRSLQPDIVINDRLPGFGDYETPEQGVPLHAPDGWWETCLTMNGSWGYVPDDDRYLSARSLVHMLTEVAGKGGNLLLNVSPGPTGALPAEQIERLEQVARWMDRHRDAVIGTSAALEPGQFYGPATRRDNALYLHAIMRPYEAVVLRGVPIKRVKSARVVGTGAALSWRGRATIADQLGSPDPRGELTLPIAASDIDEVATVVEITFDGDW
ncbi:MAG: alpha-L-fucosidase [Acidimicrobiales bacterium]